MSLFIGPSGIAISGGGIALQGVAPPEPDTGSVNPNNSLTISDAAATTTSNYPIQLGRAFIQGEIADYPRARVDGVAVTTQAHVETRWDDGSVKFAVMFFHIPSLPSGGSVEITFQNQATGNTTGGLSAATILADWDFEATMELVSGGVTKTASARTMLTGGHYWALYSGSVATCLVIEDHSSFATYDFGWDAYTPVRPIFHATFWPLTEQTKVRYIGELSKTTQLESVTVDTVALTVGEAIPSTVYSKATSTLMNYGSRWTKSYWKGGTPSTINVNHNLAYLASTTLVPNYDTDRVMPESSISSKYSSWTAASKDLYDAGNWQKTMSMVGGRPDIGMFPGWVVWWLYSGDYRMEEMALGNADLAGAWPMHFREAQYGRTRKFERTGNTDAGGKVLSINTRPTLFLLSGINSSVTAAGDKMTIVGSTSVNSWGPDSSHQPDPYSIPYLLTGDYFYLEQMWFWAGYSAAYLSPANVYYGARGPSGYYGGLEYGGETRKSAWIFRNRAQTAALTPSRFADEKTFFTTLTNDAIAVWEGVRDLASPRSTEPTYTWGNGWLANKWIGGVVTPFNNWVDGVTVGPQNPGLMDWTVTYRAKQNWQDAYMLMALGRAQELGFSTDILLEYASGLLSGWVTNGVVTPHYLAVFLTPYSKISGDSSVYFTDYADLVTGYQPEIDDAYAISQWENQLLDVQHGYSNIIMCGAAYTYDSTDGPTVWTWIETNARTAANLARLDGDPKWAILPRNLP